MYKVEFYEDKHGRQPVREVLAELRDKAADSKDASIQYQKILAHIRALESYGTRSGEPQVKHIDGGLWELRPLPQEIEQAKQCMKDDLERNG
jgi:phage-related protein